MYKGLHLCFVGKVKVSEINKSILTLNQFAPFFLLGMECFCSEYNELIALMRAFVVERLPLEETDFAEENNQLRVEET